MEGVVAGDATELLLDLRFASASRRASSKLCVELERDVTTFVLTFSYAEPTLSSKERNDSEFLSCPSFEETDVPNPPRSDEVFSAVVLITDSVFW